MDDWIQILSNQWYRTLSIHDITRICCEINRLPREHITRSHVNLIKVGFCGKMSTMQQKISLTVTGKFTHVQIFTLYSKKHACNWRKKTVINGFFDFLNQKISNVSNIHNTNKNPSLASNGNVTVCFQIQSHIRCFYIFFG